MRIGKSVALTMMVASLAACESAEQREKKLVEEARDAFISSTKDPMSWQFRKVAPKGDDILCGEVNTTDEAGKYRGFVVFMVNRKTGVGYTASPDPFFENHSTEVLDTCADAKQKARFIEGQKAVEAEANRKLQQLERENEITHLKAQLKMKQLEE
ncbi:MAG: hypothetical protein AABZ76_07355 [Pseudomonadota bacterium]